MTNFEAKREAASMIEKSDWIGLFSFYYMCGMSLLQNDLYDYLKTKIEINQFHVEYNVYYEKRFEPNKDRNYYNNYVSNIKLIN